jgi:small subunit ribosomal protein S11
MRIFKDKLKQPLPYSKRELDFKKFFNRSVNSNNFKKRFKRKKLKLYPVKGILTLKFSSNNTLGSLSDLTGKLKYKISTGLLNFKNSKKSSAYASESAIRKLAAKAYELGYDSVILHLNGHGRGKNKCLDSINKSKIRVVAISDYMSIPHNGCRPPKIRRL